MTLGELIGLLKENRDKTSAYADIMDVLEELHEGPGRFNHNYGRAGGLQFARGGRAGTCTHGAVRGEGRARRMGAVGVTPAWMPTVRWTQMDNLSHLVSYDHRRFCDGQPVRGCNHETGNVTCVFCAVMSYAFTRKTENARVRMHEARR